jgi:PHD/YefM family antitoxin component YafN of YafNO toxin-antitoxin module
LKSRRKRTNAPFQNLLPGSLFRSIQKHRIKCERGVLMLDLENGIESLTNFKRNTADSLQQLHQTGTPLVLTVNGRAEVVVQDAVAWQRLLERAARADLAETVEAIRGGLADSAAGRVMPARKALQALAKKYGSHVHGTGPPLCTHC